MTIRIGALARSFGLVAGLLACSAAVITTSWSQLAPEHHVVVGRVQITTVAQPLKLAEPNPISFQVGGERVTSVVAGWFYYVNNTPTPAEEEDKVLPVTYDSNGGASVSVIPLKLGKVQLTLLVSFADGGVERKTIDLQVGQAGRQPEKLLITLGGDYRSDTPVLYLDLSEANRARHVDPAVIYKNVTSPVPLKASDVTFKLINSTGAAEIDPSTGIVTARYVGQALLETSFAGVSTLTCIDVMNDMRMGPRSRCQELLPPGKRLPPSGMELDPTPPPVVKVYRP